MPSRRVPALLALAVSYVALACGAFSGADDTPTSGPPAASPDGGAPADATSANDAASAVDAAPDAGSPSCPYPPFPTNGSAYRTAVVADCPAAYFRMDEPAGAKVAASAVDQKTAPINGGAQPGYTFGVPGYVGTAIDFTAQNEGFAFDVAIVPGSRFTFETWVRPKTNVGTQPVFLDADAAGQGITVDLTPTANDLTAAFSVRVNNAAIRANATIPLPNSTGDLGWHHVAAVADGTTYRVYLDGKEGTVLASVPLTKTGVPLSFGNFFTGSYDEVAIYDRPLSKERIAAHAASPP